MKFSQPLSILSKESSKAKEAEGSSSPPKDELPPPAYQEFPPEEQLQSQLNGDEPVIVEIPSLKFLHVGTAETTTVDRDRCILHLKLLAALADLRETISTTDGLFGIGDYQIENFQDEQTRGKALVRVREKRWAVYTARAVDRYADWWTSCIPVSEAFPTIDSIQEKEYTALTDSPELSSSMRSMLPPLGKLILIIAFFGDYKSVLIRDTKSRCSYGLACSHA